MLQHAHLLLRCRERRCLHRIANQHRQHQQRKPFHCHPLSRHISHMHSLFWMVPRLVCRGVSSGTKDSLLVCSRYSRASFACPVHQHQLSAYSATEACSSGLTELECQTSCCVIWCWQNATETRMPGTFHHHQRTTIWLFSNLPTLKILRWYADISKIKRFSSYLVDR